MRAHDIVRAVHGYTGMAALALLLMYLVTAYPAMHPSVLSDAEPQKATFSAAMRYRGSRDSSAFVTYLQDAFDLRGQAQEPAHLADGSWRFRFLHPGSTYEALVSARGDSVRITHYDDGLRRTLISLHRLHGRHGGWAYHLWAWCYDLASISPIIFVVTGVWLWYHASRRRFLGWLVLLAGFAYTGATILYLIWAP